MQEQSLKALDQVAFGSSAQMSSGSRSQSGKVPPMVHLDKETKSERMHSYTNDVMSAPVKAAMASA